MRVVIDISPLKSAHKTRGIGTYTRNLIENLRRVDQRNDYILTSKPHHIKADLIHYPYFDFFFSTLPIYQSLPTVVTIHDTIPLIFPKQYPSGLRGKIMFYHQRLALKSVNIIITDSKNSKKDIVRFLKQPSNKIYPIYLAAGHQFTKASQKKIAQIREKYHLPTTFALYVGDINYNKNLPFLIKAFAQTDPHLHLVFVARALKHKHLPETKAIFQAAGQFNIKNRFHSLTNVPLDPPSDLVGIYSAATVYIQPSLYEGFGLTLLEALRCQTPVISSQAASLPEVGGNAVTYFNPKNTNSLVTALTQILTLSPSKKQQLTTKGLQRASKFSWEKTALDTIKAYQQALPQ